MIGNFEVYSVNSIPIQILRYPYHYQHFQIQCAGNSTAGSSRRISVVERFSTDESREDRDIFDNDDHEIMGPQELVERTFQNLFPDSFQCAVPIYKHKVGSRNMLKATQSYGRFSLSSLAYSEKHIAYCAGLYWKVLKSTSLIVVQHPFPHE